MLALHVKLPTLPTTLDGVMTQPLQHLAAELIAEAQEGWPVRTGDSRDGFYARVSDGEILLGNTEAYAPHVRVKGANRPAIESVGRRVQALATQRTEELAAAVTARLKG